MSEDKEKISAWLDDAVDASELASLEQDIESGNYCTVSRYQMVGDALRGRVSDAAMVDVSAAVREAISREPGFETASRTAAAQTAATRQKRSLFDNLDLGAWLRPVGGLAVAATVAMVMVVTFTEQPDTDSTAIVNVGQQPVQSLPVNNAPVAYRNTRVAMPAVNAPAFNLNNYVNEYSEYAAQDTVQGLMPYARAVSYETENNFLEQKRIRSNQEIFQRSK